MMRIVHISTQVMVVSVHSLYQSSQSKWSELEQLDRLKIIQNFTQRYVFLNVQDQYRLSLSSSWLQVSKETSCF